MCHWKDSADAELKNSTKPTEGKVSLNGDSSALSPRNTPTRSTKTRAEKQSAGKLSIILEDNEEYTDGESEGYNEDDKGNENNYDSESEIDKKIPTDDVSTQYSSDSEDEYDTGSQKGSQKEKCQSRPFK